ncbi:uncharacterized protein LOC122063289 isoform X2 [Macadamia integrifolia]|uniref:uncharacterized protein LOC122063289 isoform X2 n=1 Tax=Macadamia integrifolia TaxID=60698 RepID=UPI001C4F0C47|nr:uncharacterized protein LOC122063289 isoform X2 [Macadamia integrifolia]
MKREISSRAPSDHYCGNVSTPKLRYSAAQKMDDKEEHHQMSDPKSIDTKKKSSSHSSCHSRKCIHVIVLIVFICWFIVWWFSNPVNVEIKMKGFFSVHRFMAQPMNNIQDDLPTMLTPSPSNGLAPLELNSGSEIQQLDVEKKDGRIVAVHRFMALPMDNTRDNLPTMLPPTSSNGLAPQELNNGTEPQQSVNVADKDGSIVSVHRFMAPPMENTTQDNLATMFPPTPSDGFAPQELNNGSELRKIM